MSSFFARRFRSTKKLIGFNNRGAEKWKVTSYFAVPKSTFCANCYHQEKVESLVDVTGASRLAEKDEKSPHENASLDVLVFRCRFILPLCDRFTKLIVQYYGQRIRVAD